jgi:hypothetical protein
MDTFAVIPSPRGEGFVELSADDSDLVELSRKPSGRVFRKQILHYGDLHYGGQTVKIDENFVDTLVANFSNNVCDIVQAPKAGDKNEHTENPDRNVGEVIAVHKNAKGAYVDIDVRTDDADKMGKTLLGASAMLHMDYTDTRSNKRVGPTLLHTAITNRPYVTGLDGFEEIIAASASGEGIETVVLTSTPIQEEAMTREEHIAALKADGLDVADLQRRADEGVALSNAVRTNFTEFGLIQLSNGEEASPAEIVGLVTAAGSKIVELTGTIDTMNEEAAKLSATAAVDELVAAGKVLPKDKDHYVELKLTQPDLFEKFVPEKPIVELSAEGGTSPIDTTPDSIVAGEIARLSNVAKSKLDAPVSIPA